jgi:Replication protein A OB domain
MTFWAEEIDKFMSKFEEGKIYIISNADIKKAGNFNKSEHSCELSCNRTTQITEGQDTNSIKAFDLNLENLSLLKSEKLYANKTVFCIIHSKPEFSEMIKKDGTPLQKTTFQIIDQSQQVVEVVGWGEHAWERISAANAHDIVVITNLSVREFGGNKNFSFSYPESKIVINPPIAKEKMI